MSLPRPEQKREFVEQMFDEIAPRYDLVNRLMTFGIDRTWRRRAVEALHVGPGSRVIDLGCGTGDLVADVERTGADAVGIDLSGEMIAVGRRRLAGRSFVRGDAQCLPFPDASFDGVVSGFALRNFTSIPAAMQEAARVLRPGGRFALLEVNVPAWAPLRVLFNLYFTRVVPFIGRLFSRGFAYDYLAASVEYLPEFGRYRAILEDAGFVDVRRSILLGGVAQLVTAERAPAAERGSTEPLAGAA
ncbi:MAG: ubiquinone/menaquinone biosynthesis methyltransferase [Alphaproteobacteria bacterium]